MEEKLTSLKPYFKNPRKITEQNFKRLGETLMELGDLSGVVVNNLTGEVIGGNQRVEFFKRNREACTLEITKRYEKPTPTGTVAIGYILDAGERYSYREVEWDEKTAEKANIIANRSAGFWDNDILANQFDVIELKDWGFSDMELGMGGIDLEKEKEVSFIAKEKKENICPHCGFNLDK
jgi:hypothetical protein